MQRTWAVLAICIVMQTAAASDIAIITKEPEPYVGRTVSITGIVCGNLVSKHDVAGGYLFSIADETGEIFGNSMSLVKRELNYCGDETTGKAIEALGRNRRRRAAISIAIVKEGKDDCCGSHPYYMARVQSFAFLPDDEKNGQ